MASDKSYKALSDRVYRQDSHHEKHQPVVEGDIEIIDGIDYQVLKAEDSQSGMQAMAVAPVTNGKVDTSEVIIAYAGTNKEDLKDIETDLRSVVVNNKFVSDKVFSLYKNNPLKPKISNYITKQGQVNNALDFASAVHKEYPNATYTTTGHSLGQFLALTVAAENQWSNVGFNGPDPYNILSAKAKNWCRNNSHRLINYCNAIDIVGICNGNKTGAQILVDMEMGSSFLKSHNLRSWQFDDDGKLIISDLPSNAEANRIRAEKQMYKNLDKLAKLKKKFKASGGGLSGNEKIYLNDQEALIAVQAASQAMQQGLETLTKLYDDAIEDLTNKWEDSVNAAQAIGTDLTRGEVIAALAAGGATKSVIVNEPKQIFEEQKAKIKNIAESFSEMAAQIKDSINTLVQKDQNLANQIKGDT